MKFRRVDVQLSTALFRDLVGRPEQRVETFRLRVAGSQMPFPQFEVSERPHSQRLLMLPGAAGRDVLLRRPQSQQPVKW